MSSNEIAEIFYKVNVPVKAGWNMIGSSIKSEWIDVSGIYIQNTFSTYENGAYVPLGSINRIDESKAYWIKVLDDGNIELRESTVP